MARVRDAAKVDATCFDARPFGMIHRGLALALDEAYAAAALALVGTAEIVFRICEAIW